MGFYLICWANIFWSNSLWLKASCVHCSMMFKHFHDVCFHSHAPVLLVRWLVMLTAQLFSLHAHPSWAPQTEGPNSAAIFAEMSAWSADCPPSIIDIERHLGIACYLSIIMICMNAGEHESWIRNLLQVGHVHRASSKLYMINCENLHFHLCSNVKTASQKKYNNFVKPIWSITRGPMVQRVHKE